jgi:hypothetical protein
MTTATFTEKQRQAIEAMEGARGEGLALSNYAAAHGLNVRELYDAIACLRRKGLLPKPMKKQKSKFVAVRLVAPSEPAQAVPSRSTGGVLCRIVCQRGPIIECTQGPTAGVAGGAHGTFGCCDLTAGLKGCTCIEHP